MCPASCSFRVIISALGRDEVSADKSTVHKMSKQELT